jgi:hypothetical protein
VLLIVLCDVVALGWKYLIGESATELMGRDNREDERQGDES